MEVKDAQEIGDKVGKIIGINIFENTRKRDYVESRSLVVFLLREKLLMRWVNIAKYFEDNGKHMNHANAIHLFKMYPIYKRDNKQLSVIEQLFIFKNQLNYDEIDKFHYLENRYKDLKKENDLLIKKLAATKKRQDPILDIIKGITLEQRTQVIERLSLLKKSWSWKSVDRCEVIEAGDGISGATF
tara:strand:- start:1289 stop:1846 length:558 start_codon:yes stop_codon:yes gene_type:complete